MTNMKLYQMFFFNICILLYIQGPQKLKYGKGDSGDKIITAKDIIIATGSVPLVPKGIEVDGSYLSALHISLKLFALDFFSVSLIISLYLVIRCGLC